MKGKGLTARILGKEIRIGNADFVNLNRAQALLRTHAFVSIDHNVRGCFILGNAYREGLEEVITDLDTYSHSLISGDHQGEKGRLRTLFGEETPLLFQQSPEEKLLYIQNLRKEGHKVMMIGDGLNDAGALKMADIGMAISDNNLHFSPACDVILEGKKFRELPTWMKFAKGSISLVKIAFVISICYNLVGLTIAVQGLLSPLIAAILMPVSSLSIVGFGLISTHLKSPERRK